MLSFVKFCSLYHPFPYFSHVKFRNQIFVSPKVLVTEYSSHQKFWSPNVRVTKCLCHQTFWSPNIRVTKCFGHQMFVSPNAHVTKSLCHHMLVSPNNGHQMYRHQMTVTICTRTDLNTRHSTKRRRKASFG